MVELEEISNISRSIINSSDYQPVINKQNMKELVNHLYVFTLNIHMHIYETCTVETDQTHYGE